MENKSKLSKFYIFIPLALLCCFLWGSAFPSIKVGYALFDISADDSYSQIFCRNKIFLAGIMVIAVGSVMQKRVLYPKGRAEFGRMILLSLFQTILQYTLFYIGLAHTSGVKSSILIAVNVFFSIIISTLVFKIEKLTVQKSVGAAVGFIGIIIINLTADGFGGGFSLNGEGAMILSSLAYSVSSVLIKKYSQNQIQLCFRAGSFCSAELL